MYSRWSSGADAPGEITGEMCNEARKNQTQSDKVDQSWSDEYRYNDIVIWNFRDARLHYVITDVIRIGLTIDYPFPHVREYCVKISAFSDKYKQPCCRKEKQHTASRGFLATAWLSCNTTIQAVAVTVKWNGHCLPAV